MTNEMYQQIMGAFEKSFSGSAIFDFLGGGDGKKVDKNISLEDYGENSIKYYTSKTTYVDINNFMHQREFFYSPDFTIKDIVGNIYGLAKSMKPVEKDITVFRGASDKHFRGLLDNVTGTELPLRSFTSATTRYGIADYYARFMRGRMVEDVTPIVFEIDVPKGTPCFVCGVEDTDFQEEKEIILPPALYSIVNIRDKRKSHGVMAVELKMLNPLNIKEVVLDALEFNKRNVNSMYSKDAGITMGLLKRLESAVCNAGFPNFQEACSKNFEM